MNGSWVIPNRSRRIVPSVSTVVKSLMIVMKGSLDDPCPVLLFKPGQPSTLALTGYIGRMVPHGSSSSHRIFDLSLVHILVLRQRYNALRFHIGKGIMH